MVLSQKILVCVTNFNGRLFLSWQISLKGLIVILTLNSLVSLVSHGVLRSKFSLCYMPL